MGIGRLPRKNNPKKDDEPKSKFRRIGTCQYNRDVGDHIDLRLDSDILMVPWKYYGAVSSADAVAPPI